MVVDLGGGITGFVLRTGWRVEPEVPGGAVDPGGPGEPTGAPSDPVVAVDEEAVVRIVEMDRVRRRVLLAFAEPPSA
ncbi:hypothetical protein [Embleya sp. NPDC020630]|uniref:hypothetical protein n=1 Tax=Embleya sp. NPDC020630 TaxID=3363979 RepID=UPI0037B0AC7C